jgi:hypothetical protein
MDREDTHARAELSRLLIVADPSLDPHRLVGPCCELATGDALTVSLLVPAAAASAARSEGSARAVRLLSYAATLPDAAGIRLEDVMVGEEDGREADELVRLGGFDSQAAGLVLALRLLHTPAGRVKALPALREGAR